MIESNLIAIQNSSLWAAYGDALGFISELVDQNGLKRRANTNLLKATLPWKRLIGGKFGSFVDLPAGCYSDDTQLRLATSRAIRTDGHFDVEVFAKIELPIWISYALGAGRGSKIAANSLSNQDKTWFSNFFSKYSNRYVDGGGNGAAMRIQPHVWAYNNSLPFDFIVLDIVKNAICTHGHPRGILGAVFHAHCLSETMTNRKIPDHNFWATAAQGFDKVLTLMSDSDEIRTFWIPYWERESKKSLEESFSSVKEECLVDIERIQSVKDKDPRISYEKAVGLIGGLDEKSRGSGIKTALLASFLSWLYRDSGPSDALITAANLLFSDTDTIATMAGAILGVLSSSPPENDILDREYISNEATRLYKVSTSQDADTFIYPDLFKWKAPRSQMDVVGHEKEKIIVSGLGVVKGEGKKYFGKGRENPVWQWLNLEFGQSVLIKRREELHEIREGNYPIGYSKIKYLKTRNDDKQISIYKEIDNMTAPLFKENYHSKISSTNLVDKHINEIRNHYFDVSLLGRHLMEYADNEDAIELAISYLSKLLSEKMYKINMKGKNHKANLLIDKLTDECIESDFKVGLIGKHIIQLYSDTNSLEHVIAYATIILKAKRTRLKKYSSTLK